MSFDVVIRAFQIKKVLIPFEQGDVFRRNALFIISMEKDVLIPFEQGDVFRP